MSTEKILPLDDNRHPLTNIDSYFVTTCVPTAFAGGTTNARGDNDGTSDPFTLFNVTGDVILKIYGVCTTLLAGTGTLEVGVTGNTAALIAQTTGTDIDANEIWNDASPVLGVETYANILGPYVVVNGLDIIETVGTADITSGNIYYVCLWRPLTPGSTVVSAV